MSLPGSDGSVPMEPACAVPTFIVLFIKDKCWTSGVTPAILSCDKLPQCQVGFDAMGLRMPGGMSEKLTLDGRLINQAIDLMGLLVLVRMLLCSGGCAV
jgi:hypothetical protein